MKFQGKHSNVNLNAGDVIKTDQMWPREQARFVFLLNGITTLYGVK